jgi:hypothetical protein
MNILEKFLELFNKCIIILSGFEQLHLSEYAKKLAENFNFDIINFDYPNYDNLNEIVKNNKNKGLVIYGLSFERDLIKFRPSIHISLSGPKHIIKDDEKYNIYTENVKKSFINKFKNVKDATYSDDVYDYIFDLCITMIKKRVYAERYEEVEKEYTRLSTEESEKAEKEKKKKEEKAQKKDEPKKSIEKQLKKDDESTDDTNTTDTTDTTETTNSTDSTDTKEDKIIKDTVNAITETSPVGGKYKRVRGTRIIKNRLKKN